MPGDENDDCGIRLFRLPEVREGAPVRDENCLELLGEAVNGTTERFEEIGKICIEAAAEIRKKILG